MSIVKPKKICYTVSAKEVRSNEQVTLRLLKKEAALPDPQRAWSGLKSKKGEQKNTAVLRMDIDLEFAQFWICNERL